MSLAYSNELIGYMEAKNIKIFFWHEADKLADLKVY